MLKAIILVSFILTAVHASDFPIIDSVTDEVFLNFKRQYEYCTGDTSELTVSKIISWRRKIRETTESSDYKQILKEFMIHTGIIDSFLPCDVINWKLTRDHYISSKEDSIKKELSRKNEEAIDSILFFQDSLINPGSKFDFEGIHFGYDKRSFDRAYKLRRLPKYTIERGYLSADYYTIAETPFLIRFYFNRDGRFFKYEIESYRFDGNRLDDKVRIAAKVIMEKFTQKFGEPAQIYRIGFFDIKSSEPKPWAVWKSATHNAVIFIVLENGKYFTRAVVSPKESINSNKKNK